MFEEKFLERLSSNDDLDTGHRIYKNNIISNRIAALEGIFKATLLFLGEDFFKQSAREYAKLNAPKTSNLNLYGDVFGAYLSKIQGCKNFEYLKDMADFEYLVQKTFYTKDSNNLTAIDISKGIEPTLLDPTVSIFKSNYDIYNIVKNILDNKISQINLDKSEYSYLIYRDVSDKEIYVKNLSPISAKILDIILKDGINQLSDELMTEKEGLEFITFLLTKNLFIK